ncbi:MAG: TonB-dependent receptor, partial [candidate division KSB1 bacterium]|nr:TonB-dependent receptor [candidate division KSB1 bacterium]
LKPQPVAAPEVTVTAERDRLTRQVNLSQEVLSGQEIRMMSTVAEPDLFRSLALLPGVIQANDFNTRFYVRGGRGNENHILVDGVTIHNPYHALGFFSTFDVDAIKAVEIYRGIFPARYSERLSSVTNVILRDGNAQRLSGLGMISLVTSKFLLEGPLIRYQAEKGRKWTWMVSGRRTYIDHFTKFPYYFYDLSAKSVYDSGRKTRLVLHGFYGRDHVHSGSSNEFPDITRDIDWRNRALGLQWHQFFSPKYSLTSCLSYSDFQTDLLDPESGQEDEEALRQLNSIRELSFSTEGNGHLMSALQFTLGYSFSRFNIDQYLDSFFREVFQGRWRKHDQHKAYLSLEGNWQARWIYDFGVTWLYFSANQKHTLAPRLGMKCLITDAWRMKAGFGRHYQVLTTINDEDDQIVFFEAWIPSPADRPIAQADHYGLGLEFGNSPSLGADVEVYYRRYDGLTRYNRSQRKGEPFYLDGWAESYGLEIRAYYNLRSYYGFVNYAWGHATSHFFLRNQPMRYANDFRWQSFPSAGDVRHALNAVLGIRPKGKWDCSLSVIFQTGRPYTAALGVISNVYEPPRGTWDPVNRTIFQSIYDGECVFSARNSFRFPFYQRVDFRAARNFVWLNMECSFFVQIYNILFRRNTAFHFPYLDSSHSERTFGLPLLPTFGITFRF